MFDDVLTMCGSRVEILLLIGDAHTVVMWCWDDAIDAFWYMSLFLALCTLVISIKASVLKICLVLCVRPRLAL